MSADASWSAVTLLVAGLGLGPEGLWLTKPAGCKYSYREEEEEKKSFLLSFLLHVAFLLLTRGSLFFCYQTW